MENTHVINSRYNLTDQPRRLLLFEVLGFPVPRFAGMGSLLGPDRRTLGDDRENRVEFYHREGYLPEGVINYLVRPEADVEVILSLKKLAADFSLEAAGLDPVVLDRERLKRDCGRAIRQADLERLTNLALPFLRRGGFLDEEVSEERYSWVKKTVEEVRGRIDSLGEITARWPGRELNNTGGKEA
jgi:nondiscriminating glutamyl-tRNA synthetase